MINKVCIVDDSPLELKYIARSLSVICDDIICFDDPSKALNYLFSDPHVDLLLTDYVMPKMNGRQLIENVKMSPLKNMPIIILSSIFDSQLIEDMLGPKIKFAEKPVNVKEIIPLIKMLSCEKGK